MTHPSRRPYFLNPDVAREVGASRVLFAMWVATRSTYDDEIEPLHNAHWVANARSDEQDHLDALKIKLAIVDDRTLTPEERAHQKAQTVTCPICNAHSGTPCNWPGAMGAFHRERLVAAR